MQIHRGRLFDHVHDFGSDELFVSQVNERSQRSHIHLAFQVSDREAVENFYHAALKAGVRDNGAPGERSAESVVITPK